MEEPVQEESSSSQNVNIYITGISTKGAFTEVSISTGASFFVSDSVARRFSFSKRDSVPADVLELLEKEHKFILCSRKALDLLSLSEHSEFMLRTKLRQRKFEPDIITAVLANLEEKKYLDDRRFARLWVKSRLRRNPAGYSVLIAGLRSKGISSDVAEEIVADSVDDDVLLAGAEKVYDKLSGRKEINRKKIEVALLRRGYSMSVVRKVCGDRELL